jgi:hypothetical protein
MRFAALAVAASLMLAGTRASAQTVTYDFDKNADFSQLKTYAWVRGGDLSDQLNHQRIVNAVNAQLAARGFHEVAIGADPDVVVSYRVDFSKDYQVNGYSTGWGGTRLGPGRTGSAHLDENLMGTLGVDMRAAKTHAIIWKASATKKIDVKANPETRERNIDKAAEKMFKNYPPKS